MYRTRIFLIWCFICSVEFTIFFVLNYFSLYVPEEFRQRCEDHSFKERRAKVIQRRMCLNWPLISIVAAAVTVIVFAVRHYGEIIRGCFDGRWFGHLITLSGLFLMYEFIVFALIAAIYLGEQCRRNYLENYYWQKYCKIIE